MMHAVAFFTFKIEVIFIVAGFEIEIGGRIIGAEGFSERAFRREFI